MEADQTARRATHGRDSPPRPQSSCTYNDIVKAMPYSDAVRQRAFQRRWLAQRREAWLRGKACARCGCADIHQLQLDHIDPASKVDHRCFGWSSQRRAAELAKIQVLCRARHIQKGLETGELLRTAVLDPERAQAIRTIAGLWPNAEIAAKFGVTKRTIADVLARRSWKFV